ncbi:HEAT repeat domain-containing protein [Herbiconiux sp. KACC 21604]|uniref:HEAT repeat domain-containing protein n=1 Tax=unclassified Herbiconiux TaxID=2618217 RepID=UPI00149221B4|nr:HEAT repeat domain-containing protein [Herbiconiux sp. SALV-R1]QJU53532.1 HEAT repeat domain-containing protein [Herbiconiux sp. SALV-R1]WPO88512.1 HEAT repeat domain-containing protein [Herbiconiux sp. KACC 21604]
MSSPSAYRADLAGLPAGEWAGYLAEHSGLPGPRANLTLAQAVADTADERMLHTLSESTDEYEALCGTIGLGRLLAEAPAEHSPQLARRLADLATDDRWRVREGVALALQRLGDADRPAFWALLTNWSGEWHTAAPPSADGLLRARAVAAAAAEPRLVKQHADALGALRLLDGCTALLLSVPAESRRADARLAEAVRVLRQTLGYAFSVVGVAAPAETFSALERLASSNDRDARRIVRDNLTKTRLTKADPTRASALSARLAIS